MLKRGLKSLNSDQWTNKKGLVSTISRIARGGTGGEKHNPRGAGARITQSPKWSEES